MVRQESIDKFNNYIKEELSRHYITVDVLEVKEKKFNYYIKSPDRAQLLEFVICDNVQYAAELVCEINKSDNLDLHDWMDKFTEEAIKLGIDPNQPVGLDIIVF